ncbi:MAG TPA: alpha-glucan family phosphorylase, partial [Terrimicrobiaceae bacterium]|nr:alpha-glucan family phosphorylase [Terrimicrobiaceae bacterium]
MNSNRSREQAIAYFSMEIALEPAIPTYSGGLGVLAGDTIRAAADRGLPMVVVTLLYRKGYFYQELDANGGQSEQPAEWVPEDFLEELKERVTVTIEDRSVQLRAWRYQLRGVTESVVPVYLLDSDLEENASWDRSLTDSLYGGDRFYRLCQEVILGIGGVKMLRALGHSKIARFHMNEGHASLLTVALLDEQAHRAGRTTFNQEDIEAVRRQCVFTTHTPVAAGHDRFPVDMVIRVLGRNGFMAMKDVFCCEDALNMTYLALNLSHYVNGVAKKHGEVSRLMFAGYAIDAITNGVHVPTWTSPPFQALFDRYIPGWREDSFNLRYALSIPMQEIWDAHCQAKTRLVNYVNRETNAGLDTHDLTLGFARRAASYKRGDLLFQDLDRLRELAARVG